MMRNRASVWFLCAVMVGPVLAGSAHAQIANGSFETGDFTDWEAVDLSGPFFPLIVGPAGVTPGFDFFGSDPTDGVFAALHGWDGDGPGTIAIAQDLILPPGAAEVMFDYRGAWNLTFGATLPREFRVDIEEFGGGDFLQRDVLLIANPGTVNLDTGDLVGIVDVSSFAGEAVRVSFEWFVPENFTGPAFFQLDHVTLVGSPVADRTLIIKQGACPAPVNPDSNGLTPMLLVGDIDFDISQVELSSLQLSRCDGIGEAIAPYIGPPGPGIKIVDLNHPNEDDVGCAEDQVPCACNDDQSSDGIHDLLLRFDTGAMTEAFMLDSELMGAVITLFLTGELVDGTQFVAGDCIRILGPPGPTGLLVVEASQTDVWVDVDPVDDLLDGGGFTPFERGYPQGSIVQLTAPPTLGHRVFAGWVINGQPHADESVTISVVLADDITSAAATYKFLPGTGVDDTNVVSH